MRNKEEYIEAGGRCKQSMYVHRHRVVKMENKGYRCKWCGKPLSALRKEEKRKV